MPVQTDVPIGIGARDDWGLYGSAPNKFVAVAVNDGDTSLVFADSGGQQNLQLYTFPVLVGVTDPVTGATLTSIARAFNEGYQTRYFYHWWNSVQQPTNQGMYVAGNFPNYVGVQEAMTALTLADVNGEHGFMQAGSGGPSHKWECWVTQFYRTVTYSFPAATNAGDFAFLMASLVGALIGPGLLLSEMPRLSRAMGRIRLLRDEYEPAWRGWNAQRHMVMVG